MLHLFVSWRTDTIFADRVRFDNRSWRNLCDPAGYALRVSGKLSLIGMIVKVVRVCQVSSPHAPSWGRGDLITSQLKSILRMLVFTIYRVLGLGLGSANTEGVN